jgi:hypothetical protein
MAEARRGFTDEECALIREMVLDLVRQRRHDDRYKGLATILLETLEEIVRRNAAVRNGGPGCGR